MSEGRRLRDSPWVRRLPFLVVVLVGLLFLLPRFPRKVEIDYDLGAARKGLQKLDVEILDGRGRVVHRTVFLGPEAGHPVQHLRLAQGPYEADLELTYANRIARRSRGFRVGHSGIIELDVSTP